MGQVKEGKELGEDSGCKPCCTGKSKSPYFSSLNMLEDPDLKLSGEFFRRKNWNTYTLNLSGAAGPF